MNHAVRERFPDPEEVFIVSVIDLSTVPSLYWPTVGLVLGSAYEQAAKEVLPDVNPADYLVILSDWGGRFRRDYGVRNTGRAAAVVVVDEESNITVSYRGERPVEAVLKALEDG